MNNAPTAQIKPPASPAPVNPLFLAEPRVPTFLGSFALTTASGFFFKREDRLYLVTSRHVIAASTQPTP